MLGMSDLLPKLQGFVQPNGQPYVIYGDPAYPITCNILAPFRGVNLTIQGQEFNRKMSQSECGMGLWKDLPEFCLLGFKKKN